MVQSVLLVFLGLAMAGGAAAACCGDTREGNYSRFNGTSLLTTARGAEALYSSSFTIQLFVKLDSSGAASAQPVIGCMNATEMRGWQVSCSGSQCCFRAYVEGSSPSLRSLCANDLSLTNWTHLTVRFTPSPSFVPGVTSSRQQAVASLFVDGRKRAEGSWGGPGAIWRSQNHAGFPALTVGGSLDWQEQANSFLVGDLDELRVWSASLTDEQILDSAFEVAACSSTSSPSNFNRIASITSLSSLILYLRNPSSSQQANYNQYSPLTLSLYPPGSSVQIGTGGQYMHKDPVLELSPSSRGVLFSSTLTQSSSSISFAVLASQLEQMDYVDLLLRDPNYDDVVTVSSPLKYVAHNSSSPSYFPCIDRFLGFHGMEQYDSSQGPDQDGWVSYAGYGAYDSQGLGLGANLESSDFLPPHTRAESQVNMRVVLARNLSVGWWVPQEGYRLQTSVTSTSPCSGSQQQLEVTLKLGMHLSPEFVNANNFEQPWRGGESFAFAAMSNSQFAVAPGAHYVVGYGKSLQLRVRARDLNVGDEVCVRVSEDPGAPLGEWVSTSTGGSQSSSCPSNLQFTEKVPLVASAAAMCQDVCQLPSCDASLSNFLPPPVFDRTFRYSPTVDAVGGIFRVCFHADSVRPPDDIFPLVDASSSSSRAQLCVIIEVLAPAPVLLAPPLLYEAVVGCMLRLELQVEDRRLNVSGAALLQRDMNGLAPQPFTFVLSFSPGVSSKCFNSHCEPLLTLPSGASLLPSPNSVTLEWTPVRQDALYKPFTLCLNAALGETWGRREVGCVQVRVRKCQVCVRAGETLETLARSFGVGYLDLYMWNPFLQRPDQLLPGMAISTGSIYTVRQGDDLQELSKRFLVSYDSLLLMNPDIKLVNESLTGGEELCLQMPLCSVDCTHSSCQLV